MAEWHLQLLAPMGVSLGRLLVRREDQLFPPGDRWGHLALGAPAHKASLVLKPSPADIHPFTIKFDLPPWNLAQDVDFRGWLFS